MSFRIPDAVAFVDGADYGLEPRLYLMTVPDGHPQILDGVGRLIWLLATAGEDVVGETARRAGKPAAEIEPDVTRFLATLVAQGLLAVDAEPGTASGRR